MHHYTRVEGGDARWKLNCLPVVTGEAEPQEGGGLLGPGSQIQVYPVYECSNDADRARGDSSGCSGHFVQIFGFL